MNDHTGLVMTTIGDRLRQVREARRMSLQQLADLAGVNKGTLWRAEDGRNVPETDTVVKIAEALGVSALWLLGQSEDIEDEFALSKLSGTERELLAALRNRRLGDALALVARMVNEQSKQPE